MKLVPTLGPYSGWNLFGIIRKRIPAQMARNNRDRDHAAFRPEDEIDELFGGASPNPQRIGCPGEDALRAAASKALPMEHEAYDHLAGCSECYREFRRYQQPNRRPSWLRAAVAAAAVLVVAMVGGAYVGRSLGIGPWIAGPQAMVLDYRDESVSRSEAGDPVRPPKMLPRKNVEATILTPTGSEPGKYELRLVDRSGHVGLAVAARGDMENFAVRVKVDLDLRSLPRGSYSLDIRRVGEDWDPHPVIIR